MLLAAGVVLAVLPLSRGVAWSVTCAACAAGAALIAWHTLRLRRAFEQNAATLSALGRSTALGNLPGALRTRMPLVLVVGDALEQVFANGRAVHVGAGAIWLRVNKPRDLPGLALAVKAWRGDRSPDGVVLTLTPDTHTDDTLTQTLRAHRQALGDTARLLATHVPGYVAVYQRLTQDDSPHWFGLSATAPLRDVRQFEGVMQAAEAEARATGRARPEARAAGLASLIGWTWEVVNGVLRDPRQPASPWPLHGAAWIDCGPASNRVEAPWQAHLRSRTCLDPAPLAASSMPWPLPEPLIDACPRRAWVPPRLRAFAHAIAMLACALALACWGAAKNNQVLMNQVAANLARFTGTPAEHDSARRAALAALTADRDRLDRYERTGVPLRLCFGMYRGAALLPVLDRAIASYEPPPSPPTIITLDSMSLFDSGRAQLKPGSTRALVGALEMIKAQPGKRILVAGHTDNLGDRESNQRLSIARASAVRDWLMEAAATPASAFAIQGYGDSRPIADNRTPEGRARNRRVEITLVPERPGA
ncbi:OmpA family protein [Caballeronia choica]|uniref:OmpA family protein n=1 Tax=Caballeronia choica TaxID=326476 RepID=A0A158JR39_9BURK|nr:OmpA family protein [Caballeronia choica]SAL70891.1 OmpA family protein [Caballeronia choica]